MEALHLDKEVDDIVAEPFRSPATNWYLVSSVALGTILVVVVIAWTAGFISIRPGSPNDTGPDDVATADTPAKRIKGNRRTRIFHLPQCSSYNRLAENNIRWFNSRESAQNAGYKLAGNC